MYSGFLHPCYLFNGPSPPVHGTKWRSEAAMMAKMPGTDAVHSMVPYPTCAQLHGAIVVVPEKEKKMPVAASKHYDTKIKCKKSFSTSFVVIFILCILYLAWCCWNLCVWRCTTFGFCPFALSLVARWKKTGHISDIHHSLHNTTYNNSDLVFDLPDFVDICRVHEYPRY